MLEQVTLTSRQQVLFDRLVELSDWASSGQFPFRIMEIQGFGSFFRGKKSPKDVDLVLRVDRPSHTPQFSKFLGILEEIRGDVKYQTTYAKPLDAMADLITRRSDKLLPGIDIVDEHSSLFSRWLEGYSWAMLFPPRIVDECTVTSPDGFARRLLRREFPKLNVIRFEADSLEQAHPVGLRCGFMVSVWTADQPDISANLRSLLSPDAIANNLFRELEYFRIQLPSISTQVDLNLAEIDLIIRTEIIPEANDNKWFERVAGSDSTLCKLRQAHEKALRAASDFDEANRSASKEISGTLDIPMTKAASLADELRAELKSRYYQADILITIRGLLLWHKSGKARTKLDPKEYVVSQLLGRGNTQTKKKANQLLAEMGWIKEDSVRN